MKTNDEAQVGSIVWKHSHLPKQASGETSLLLVPLVPPPRPTGRCVHVRRQTTDVASRGRNEQDDLKHNRLKQ